MDQKLKSTNRTKMPAIHMGATKGGGKMEHYDEMFTEEAIQNIDVPLKVLNLSFCLIHLGHVCVLLWHEDLI